MSRGQQLSSIFTDERGAATGGAKKEKSLEHLTCKNEEGRRTLLDAVEDGFDARRISVILVKAANSGILSSWRCTWDGATDAFSFDTRQLVKCLHLLPLDCFLKNNKFFDSGGI